MVTQLAGYSIFFTGKSQLSYKQLLSGISKKTLLKVSTRLLGICLSTQHEDAITSINQWFGEKNQELRGLLETKAINYSQQTNKLLYLFGTKSCLKLLLTALEMNDNEEEDKRSEALSEIQLFKALLLINDEIDKEHTASTSKIATLYPNNEPAALLMTYSFPTYDVDNFDFTEYVSCQVVKCKILFQFLQASPEGQKLLEEFCKYYGVNIWEDFFVSIAPTILSWANRANPGSVTITLKNDHELAKNSEFLKKFAIPTYDSETDYDYKQLRDNPLVQLNALEYLVTHPMFLFDKFFKGQYFLLAAINKKNKIIKDDFRSWYTTNFSEGACFNFLLKRTMHAADVLLVDKEFGEDGAPDGYIRHNKTIELYESKDVLLNGKIKQSHNIQELSEALVEKFVVDKKRDVGIRQLAANIKRVLTASIKKDSGFNPTEVKIYPYLVVHDVMYRTPGVNEILNVHFEQERQKLATEGLNISNVKDLIIIDIDTFILIDQYLSSGSLTMQELAEAYYSFANPNTTQPIRVEEFEESKISFPDFVSKYAYNKYGPNWHSRKLYDELFPDLNP